MGSDDSEFVRDCARVHSILDAACAPTTGERIPERVQALCDALAKAVQAATLNVGPTDSKLIDALSAPDGVDVVEWAVALRGLLEVVSNYDEHVIVPKVLGYLRDHVDPLRAPPRPMPTEAESQFWGRWLGHPPVAASTTKLDEQLCAWAGTCHGPGAWVPVDDPDWTWLAGPDGKAMRVTPPT